MEDDSEAPERAALPARAGGRQADRRGLHQPRRSPRRCTWRRRPSSPTAPTCCASWACATASSSCATRSGAGWSSREAGPPALAWACRPGACASPLVGLALPAPPRRWPRSRRRSADASGAPPPARDRRLRRRAAAAGRARRRLPPARPGRSPRDDARLPRATSVVVTFMYSTCRDVCPLTAQQIRGALDRLGGGGASVLRDQRRPGRRHARARRALPAAQRMDRADALPDRHAAPSSRPSGARTGSSPRAGHRPHGLRCWSTARAPARRLPRQPAHARGPRPRPPRARAGLSARPR